MPTPLELILWNCGALATAFVGAGYALPHGWRRRQERKLRRRCAKQRCLVLTYDDGPGATLTPKLLDLLGSEGSRATFFLLGRNAERVPSIVDRIAREGHELGCHSYGHRNAWTSSPLNALRDIEEGYRSLRPWVLPDAPYRAPYGKLTAWSWASLKRRGARTGWWTIDSGDTRPNVPSPQSVSDRVARDGGGVVLMHDFDRAPEREQFVLETTHSLLRTARVEGITVRRLGDLTGA